LWKRTFGGEDNIIEFPFKIETATKILALKNNMGSLNSAYLNFTNFIASIRNPNELGVFM
jgi:hypothetical protein